MSIAATFRFCARLRPFTYAISNLTFYVRRRASYTQETQVRFRKWHWRHRAFRVAANAVLKGESDLMSLIDFTLRPLADVMPWGRPDDPSDKHLSWFGLTDGWYSIDAKSARLFQYTKEMMMHLDPPSTGRGPYSDWTDYQVVRIYEDLLEMFPDTLLEVPDSVHALVQSVEARREWNRSLTWVRDAEENTALDDSLETATYWATRRKLDSLYLIDGPRMWLWRNRGRIHLQWDNSGLVTDGIPRWTATSGTVSMPVDDFVTEVHSFHQRLIAAMDERVKTISERNPFSGVRIDIPRLIEEHGERQQSLASAILTPPTPIDWTAVMASTKALQNGSTR